MNKTLLIIALLVLPISASGQELARQTDPCFDKATTQSELNTCATRALDSADVDLNRVYQQLLKKHAVQKTFIKKLKLAQEAWLKFRDAHIESFYPELNEDQLRAEGTIYSMCKVMENTRLTIERTEELKRMLNPKEGDICGI